MELCSAVPEAQAKWLIGKGITTVAAFSDLADDRSQVADKIARPAGLDPADAVACQPLKTAWRTAEAIVKADLDARARGEDAETEKVIALLMFVIFFRGQLNEGALRVERHAGEHCEMFAVALREEAHRELISVERSSASRHARDQEELVRARHGEEYSVGLWTTEMASARAQAATEQEVLGGSGTRQRPCSYPKSLRTT